MEWNAIPMVSAAISIIVILRFVTCQELHVEGAKHNLLSQLPKNIYNPVFELSQPFMFIN